jgi:ubiquinone/menaquinone biosynthesis C-methylase UbiE
MQHRGFHILPEKERREWQNPEYILSGIGLKSGMTFLDIGCGRGFFTLPAAKMVGLSGKVYALDISSENIDVLRQNLNLSGVDNVISQVGEAETTILCRACADIVFFGIVLHDFQDPLKVLANARLMLKPNGKLVNLDWKKEETPFGPPPSIRFSEAKARQLIESQGFKVKSITDSGPYHYLIMAEL